MQRIRSIRVFAAAASGLVLVTGLSVAVTRVAQPTPARSPSDLLEGVPPAFEPNRGQLDPRAHFLARAAGYSLSLTDGGAVFSISSGSTLASVRMSIEGAGAVVPRGADPLAGTVNYFLGNDPDRWQTGIPTFGRARYADVMPGIDLLFYGTPGGGIEWDLRLAPGTEPPTMAFEGAHELRLNPDGDLIVGTDAGSLLIAAPVSYQMNGRDALDLPSRFVLRGERVDFELGSRDPTLPTVIDPPVTLEQSTFLGGSEDDSARDIAVDSSGAAYVTGDTEDDVTDFPVTPGAFDTTPGGSDDVFVTKLDPSGTSLVYSTFIGGTDLDQGTGITLGPDGSAYVTGDLRDGSTDFPTTPGAYDTTPNGNDDAFILKLNPSGTALTYSTLLGGGGSDDGSDIAVDAAGAAYVSGNTSQTGGTQFPTTPGAFQGTHRGGAEAFLTKLNPSGSDLVYSTFLGVENHDGAEGVAVDGSGAAYTTGYTQNGATPFPTTPGAFDEQFDTSSNTSAFVTKFNPSGTGLTYSTLLESESSEGGDIALGPDGSAFVSGQTYSGFPTTPGAFDTSYSESGEMGATQDAFVTRVNPAGSGLLYSTYLGGSGEDRGEAIALDSAGAAYVTGRTQDHTTDFPVTPGAFDMTPSGIYDAYVAMLDPSGAALSYATFLGGNDNELSNGIAIDIAGAAHVVGGTGDEPPDFPTTPGAFDTSHNGEDDAFVAKLGTVYLCQGRSVTHLGSPAGDQLRGTKGKDVVLALESRDKIKTLGGGDRVCAGDGNDVVSGGGGKDRLKGENGKDRLKGGGGNDRLNGGKGPGKDRCAGGRGRDRAPKCEKERSIP